MTGESLPVEKSATSKQNLLYQGTNINSGTCYAKVTAIGNDTFARKARNVYCNGICPKNIAATAGGRLFKTLYAIWCSGLWRCFRFQFFNYPSTYSQFIGGAYARHVRSPGRNTCCFLLFHDPGRLLHVEAGHHHQTAAGGREPGRCKRNLSGQNRHHHREQHAGEYRLRSQQR